MESAYHELFMGLISNSPFLAWMIYSYMQTNKQLEKTREESKAEMKEIRKESKEEEAQIRVKFEKVIEGLNKDRKELVESFSGRIDSLEKGQRKIFSLLEHMKEIRKKVQKIELKEEIQKELASSHK
jgi:translation initiation factor IF-3